MESIFLPETKLTYGEGVVGTFPRGAINHPSLLTSACVLFDAVIVLRPTDVEGNCMVRRGNTWNYDFFENREADGFWSAVQSLVEIGVLKSFRTQIDLSGIKEMHAPPDGWIAQDTCNVDSDGAFATRLFAVGFTEFFRFLGTNGVPLALASTELHEGPLTGGKSLVSKVAHLGGDSAKILRSFLPEFEIPQCNPEKIIINICEIRKHLKAERLAYMSLLGKIVSTVTELSDPAACASEVDEVISDGTEIWRAYKSSLTELSGKFSMPVKFVPLLENVATLDQIDCGEHIEESGGQVVSENKRQQMIAFIWRVDQTNNFWRKR